MFTNVTKYSVWDLMTDSVKFQDQTTTQASYEGENRGQTQRYLITVGDLIVTMFQMIDSLFEYGDAQATSLDFLYYLQRQMYSRHIVADAGTEAVVRNILSEIIPAWKLKGTYAFLHWIIWKVFGWQLTTISTIKESFRLNQDFLYNSVVSAADHNVLYNSSLWGYGGSEVKLVVDVFLDADFALKHLALEELIIEWGVAFNFTYLNTP